MLRSPELNPEGLEQFAIGEAIKLDSVKEFSQQLEEFINAFFEKATIYEHNLKAANSALGQDVFVEKIL